MDDIKKQRLKAAARTLMAAHDELVDLTPAKEKKASGGRPVGRCIGFIGRIHLLSDGAAGTRGIKQ